MNLVIARAAYNEKVAFVCGATGVLEGGRGAICYKVEMELALSQTEGNLENVQEP